MRFTPKDDETIAKEQHFGEPFAKGEYEVKVVEASDETSKKGNEQIHLKVQIFNDEGNRRRTAHDYLMESMSKKLKSFCAAAGLLDEYESGELAAVHCAGQELRAKVEIEPAKDGYDAKNTIREYLPRTAARPAAPAPQRTAPTPAPAAGNGSDAHTAAWKQFLVKWNAHLSVRPDDANNRDEAWLKALIDFYPGKDSRTLSSAEWMRVGQAFRVWDAMKGFPNSGPSQAPPFSEKDEVFQDSDIPFFWSGRMGQPL